jgi:hypothetical protein
MSSSSSSPTPSASSSSNIVTENLFTSVPVNLFRGGNAGSPKLDHLRDKDIETVEEDVLGKKTIFVLPKTGGISTFDNDAKMKGKVWKIPSGTKLPATIMVVKDKYNSGMRATHYSISPAYKMTLEAYILGLQELAKSAVPTFMTAIKTGNDKLEDEAKVVNK